METEIDYKKIYGNLYHIKSSFDYTVAELKRLGLERLCIENNIDYDDLNEAEKEELWQELLNLAEEVEFVRCYNDDLHWK